MYYIYVSNLLFLETHFIELILVSGYLRLEHLRLLPGTGHLRPKRVHRFYLPVIHGLVGHLRSAILLCQIKRCWC